MLPAPTVQSRDWGSTEASSHSEQGVELLALPGTKPVPVPTVSSTRLPWHCQRTEARYVQCACSKGSTLFSYFSEVTRISTESNLANKTIEWKWGTGKNRHEWKEKPCGGMGRREHKLSRTDHKWEWRGFWMKQREIIAVGNMKELAIYWQAAKEGMQALMTSLGSRKTPCTAVKRARKWQQ